MTLSHIQSSFDDLRTLFRDPSALRARFIRGVTWSIVGVLVVQVFKLLTAIITARTLGDVGFGELGIINNTVVTFGVFAGLGLGITATKYIAQLRSHDPDRAGEVVGFLLKLAFITGGLMTVITIVLAPIIVERVLNAPHLTVELRMASILLFLNALSGVQIGTLAGLESFREIAVLSILEGALYFVLVCLGVIFWGLLGAVVGYILVATVKWLASQWALRRTCKEQTVSISYTSSNADWPILWTFALPALFVSLSSQPFSWLARVMLTGQDSGYADLGLFNAAFSWTVVLLFLPRQILRPSVSILSNLFAEGKQEQFSRLVRVNLVLVVGLSLLLATFLIILSPLIMKSYGEDFARGTNVLVIILAAYVVASITLVFRDVLTAIGEMWGQVAISLLGGLVLVAGLSLFGQTALGLAKSYFLSYIVLATSLTLFWLYLRRGVKYNS